MESSRSTESRVLEGNKVVRVYTLKDHGKDYEKLASSFALKNGFNLEGGLEEPKVNKEKKAKK